MRKPILATLVAFLGLLFIPQLLSADTSSPTGEVVQIINSQQVLVTIPESDAKPGDEYVVFAQGERKGFIRLICPEEGNWRAQIRQGKLEAGNTLKRTSSIGLEFNFPLIWFAPTFYNLDMVNNVRQHLVGASGDQDSRVGYHIGGNLLNMAYEIGYAHKVIFIFEGAIPANAGSLFGGEAAPFNIIGNIELGYSYSIYLRNLVIETRLLLGLGYSMFLMDGPGANSDTLLGTYERMGLISGGFSGGIEVNAIVPINETLYFKGAISFRGSSNLFGIQLAENAGLSGSDMSQIETDLDTIGFDDWSLYLLGARISLRIGVRF